MSTWTSPRWRCSWPNPPKTRAKVVALATAVRAAGGGPTTQPLAVTDDPQPEYGDLVHLYVSLRTPRWAKTTLR